jgi:hypothetical protein
VLPRRACTFSLEARTASGQLVAVSPPTITIVQGITIGDPPLSRTLGVALASGHASISSVARPARAPHVHASHDRDRRALEGVGAAHPDRKRCSGAFQPVGALDIGAMVVDMPTGSASRSRSSSIAAAACRPARWCR